MKKITMEFPVITFIDANGTEKIDKQKTLDKAKELIQLLKQINLRFENED
jgi:regulator of sigma D